MSDREESRQPISTEPYRGVRDFFPEDQAVQRYMFQVMRDVCERFGYEEYASSLLEPTELYLRKSSEEIVSDQTYTFEDRGGRSVTLRPETTPSVARMVASRAKSLSFPLRLFTIANVFRYERPQRGRLREHFQLNADLFGSATTEADTEVIALSSEVLKAFGLTESDFEIQVMSREVLQEVFQEHLGIEDSDYRALLRLIDARSKMPKEEYEQKRDELLGKELSDRVEALWDSTPDLPEEAQGSEAVKRLEDTIEMLRKRGVSNITMSKDLVRGFDYYTGMVFEVFDTSPEHTRSLFGGGRYDTLFDLFDAPSIPAVGFGMGDVTLRDTLKERDLLPSKPPAADLFIATLDESARELGFSAARAFRERSIRVIESVEIDSRAEKHIKRAERSGAHWIVFLGSNEASEQNLTIKNLVSGEQSMCSLKEALEKIDTYEEDNV